ncbi:phospholipase D family protein [Peribacillus frigoritolerans]|uniref:phospholipase D family protein n=1 Tax=Peribacillus frigoritolerans TaxID=450367 RepID=UPI002E24D28F|nr:phospholipase D family protein [Peribacillus frigoritolerans]
MLKPAENRLNYSDLLMPPPGYDVEFAIGTTYSLDLEALVGVPLSLSLSEEMDHTFQDDPIYVLEGIRRSADKFAIFCEAGQIKVPQNGNNLFALMENSVFEVALENDRSFHPKIWVIKYHDSDRNELYRVLVLSRNLTFDRSWDMAIALEGKRMKEKTSKNQPLANLVRFLVPFAKNKQKKKQINKLISELEYVHFDPADPSISNFEFCPLGIEGHGKADTELFETYHKLIIISPFISESIIKELNDKALKDPTKVLITRKTELHKLQDKVFRDFDVYALKDSVVEGEGAISEENAENEIAQLQDIHAKLYARTKYNQHHIFIGSANSSSNAFNGNVEFLLKLHYQKYGFKITDLLDDLFGDDEDQNPFEKIETIPPVKDEPESDITDRLQKGIKQLCRIPSRAVVLTEQDHFSLRITFDWLPEEIEFSIGPLLSENMQPIKQETLIHNLSMLELGDFYKIRAEIDGEKMERIIKIDTEGIPEERETEIFRSIIRDPYTFLKYVAFLLADDFLLSALEESQNMKLGAGRWDMSAGDYPVLYENMLKAASRSPEKLKEVESIIDIIHDEEIIPKEFHTLYQTFNKAAKKVRR